MMKKFFLGMAIALGLASCSQGEKASDGAVEVAGLGKVKPVFAYYDFKKDSLACEISGFSGCESFGRWSCADTMTVSVKGEPFSEYTVKFDVDIFYNENKHTKSVVDVYVNGEKIDQWVLKGQTSKYVSLRKDEIAQDGSSTISLVALDAISPEQCGEGLDDRRLSFCISDITLYGFKAE